MASLTRSSPPVLLTMANYYGTLAAARCLGKAGIEVTIADGRWLAPARWSRYVTRRLACPSPSEPEAYLRWLLEFGEREPGHVLLPTSDDLCWLFAAHAEELGKVFQLYQPSLPSAIKLLDKKALYAACAECGIATPKTQFPQSDAELAEAASSMGFPVLIKPRTQVFLQTHVKGGVVESQGALARAHRDFRTLNRYHPSIEREIPGVSWPMVQAYYSEAAEGIYSISGFIDQTGTAVCLRASRKVLQRPRKVGLGICFEEAPLDQELGRKVIALCRDTGHCGAFEVEFIEADGQLMLIDFNPRFFGQMGFDIARGARLPMMSWLAAQQRDSELRAEVAEAAANDKLVGGIYVHALALAVMLGLQRLSGRMTAMEAKRWREWQDASWSTDATYASDDLGPAIAEALSQVYGLLRHPRSSLNTLLLDRS